MNTSTLYYASLRIVGMENGTFGIYVDNNLVELVDSLGAALAWCHEYHENRKVA